MYHFIRELHDEGELVLEKIIGSKSHTDTLTKVAMVNKLRLCYTLVGIH